MNENLKEIILKKIDDAPMSEKYKEISSALRDKSNQLKTVLDKQYHKFLHEIDELESLQQSENTLCCVRWVLDLF